MEEASVASGLDSGVWHRLTGSAAVGREVRRLAVPAILNSLLLTLVIVVDRVMLGHHAESSLAAMQIAGPVEWTVWSLFTAFQVGTLARVGRFVGRGDAARATLTARVSLGLAIVIGLAVMALTPWLLDAAAWGASGASPAVLASARAYLSITLAASPLVLVAATSVATLQAAGDTRTPLLIGVGVNIVHVALNRVLILGAFGLPALGPRGCGISTAVTFTLEALAAVAVLGLRSAPVTLRGAVMMARGWTHVRHEGRAIATIALPSLLERALYHAGYLGFVAIIATLGDAPMAANQALLSIEAVCFLSGDGFGVAAASLVAQSLGRGDSIVAERFARQAAQYAVVMLTTLGLLAYLLRGTLLAVFSSDHDVLAEGLRTIPILLVAQPFMAVAIVLGQSLRGAGDTRGALGVSAVGALVVRLSCTWLFALKLRLGLPGVWLGSTCDWMVRSTLLAVWGRRRLRRMV
jgi:putative MATE family efflux protein